MMQNKILYCCCILLVSLGNSNIVAQNSESELFATVQNNISDMYTSAEINYTSRINKAAKNLTVLLDIVAKDDGGDMGYFLSAYNTFVQLLKKADRFNELDKYNRELMTHAGNNSIAQVNCLLHMAAAYKEDNDDRINEAIAAFEYHGDSSQGLALIEDYWPEKLTSYDNARLLAVKADLLLYGNNAPSATENFQKAYELVKQDRGEDSLEGMLFAMFVENSKAYEGKFDEALSLAVESEARLKTYKHHMATLNRDVTGRDFVEYASLLSRMAFYHQKLKHNSEELAYTRKSLEALYDVYDAPLRILNSYGIEGLPVNGPERCLLRDVHDVKLLLADNLYSSGEQTEAKSLYEEIVSDLRDKLASSSSYDKVNLDVIKNNVEPLMILGPVCALRFPNDARMAALAYNSALLYKNFSLFTEHFVLDLVQKDNNAYTTNLYNEILELTSQLDKANSDNARIIQDELRQKNEELLVNLDFSTYGQMLNTKWEDIQLSLDDNAAAVEFLLAQQENSKTYLACIVRKQGEPRIIKLCTEQQLVGVTEPYVTSDIYNLIWKPLLPTLQGIQSLYFSPTGVLCKMGIEYVPDDNGQSLDMTTHRVSTTRVLCLEHKATSPQVGNAVLFGGIIYDRALTENEKSLAANQKPNNTSRRGGGFKYLPGTLEEIKNIEQTLESGSQVMVLSGEEGSETEFKNLSGTSESVIHIATHGFYLPKQRKSIITKYTKNAFNSMEDQSLSRSGLLMAGAENTMQGYVISNDDGILTAREIARLDLTNVDLICLSACESGLGDITGEGVFGLQRGFKKAGAKSLLMSLWKVDDEATNILMTEFYKNVASGSPLNTSLLQAQQYLRTLENGKYDKPIYWAAFILLDAQ